MSEDVLQEFVGKQVGVWSQGGGHTQKDEGRLVAYDARWIKIQTSYGEILLFPVANIRLLKPLQ